ncbi:DUF1810 domain-containing protein [Sinorhizobium sp. RAC02]|uniref:DUF1810 domain-containing protein n=1 Tax=Sinorhizobium sp. RAC02 TaxID=1842534 RepID=UPI00083D5DFC|nr:DUF1810 domain-containing protein [Sinorhizobium sp. RAC02]AOF92796.1 hypothetical protein BSY16_4686 [Sinorhizobium sp. RAC02]
MDRHDPFKLSRFVDAQELAFAAALDELRAGRKETHWIWFIFPQLRALGRSPTAQFYGLVSLEEARAYLEHPVLADRLAQVTDAVLTHRGRTAHDIFGSPDDLKFRSSMTLFYEACDHTIPRFRITLERYFDGEADNRTLELIRR